MFFEALVALALVLQRFNVETTVRLDVDLVYHVRNVLRRLQTQIASVYEAATDASILTVAALMSINVSRPQLKLGEKANLRPTECDR